MQRHVTRLAERQRAVAAALALLTLCWPCASRAQTAQTRRDDWRAEMEARQRALRRHSDAARRPPRRARDTRPIYREVAEDFEQLQVRSHHLSLTAEARGGQDYKQIGKHAAEVRKRASRLKQTLALPEVDDAPKQKKAEEAFTPRWLASAVVSLNSTVQSFVWNPAFQQPDVVVLENSLRARRDLEEILRLSERIGKAAEALGKGRGAAKDH